VGLSLYFGVSKKKNFLPRWDSEPVPSSTKEVTKPTNVPRIMMVVMMMMMMMMM
jgi:hypothetical protein